MEAKKFFKGNAFKSIVALLCVLLVSGIFLCTAYGFLEVTGGEKLQRAIKGIYGTTVTVIGKDDVEITADDKDPKGLIDDKKTVGNAEILQMYKIVLGNEETDFLVQSKGKGGYGGGSVTCWIALKYDDTGITGIRKVQIADNSGQSFIGKITDSFLKSFSTGYEDGVEFTVANGYVSSGASLSSNAICNAVNGAATFAKAYFAGEEIKDPYEGFEQKDISGIEFTNAKAEIIKLLFDPTTGNFVVFSKGNEGFGNGTVTCAVTFEVNGTTVSAIKKVVIEDSENQTYIGYITTDDLGRFVSGYTDGIEFTTESGYVNTEASFTSRAICNSVNGAVAFMKAYLTQGGAD